MFQTQVIQERTPTFWSQAVCILYPADSGSEPVGNPPNQFSVLQFLEPSGGVVPITHFANTRQLGDGKIFVFCQCQQYFAVGISEP